MDLGLRGKHALVTGGSYGIGREIALGLAEEGCHVAVCARHRPRLDETVREIEQRGVKGLGVSADVTIGEDIERVVSTVVEAWGTLHVLVNNAGGGGERVETPVEEVEEQVWSQVFSRNALAAARFTMRAIPLMRRQKWGRVVTITSLQGHEAGGRPWYAMAKTAETSLTKALAMDRSLARDGITFNCVAPGAIITAGNEWDRFRRDRPDAFREVVDRDFPLGRLGTPAEVAAVVAFVCSRRASLLSGASIPADGGQSRSL